MSQRVEFGTDGVRGVAGVWPITPEVAVAMGRVAAARANGGRVVIGSDGRPSGAMLASGVAAVAVALAQGLGETGVMITASHNPWPENGFKLFDPGGAKLSDEACRGVEDALAACLAGQFQPTVEPGELRDAAADVWWTWTQALGVAAGDLSALRGVRIAVDLANGGAARAAGWLRQNTGATWVVVGGGDGAPNDGVGSEHSEALARAVQSHGCAAGIAVDGDADRCVVLDERGERVPGDAIAWCLARATGATGLAVTVMSNGALEPALPGVRVVRTAVGDRYVKAAMVAHGLPLGAEESGHVLFADFPAGDGLLTGLRVLAATLPHGSLSTTFAGFAPLPRAQAKVRVTHRPPLDRVPGLVAAQAAGEALLGANGRVFLRYSGTEPYLRILVEGADPSAVASVTASVTAAARAALS